MINFYISACDLPAAKLAADVRLYAGRGWLTLVREAMAIIGDSEIMSVREDAGALRIELARSTPEQRSALRKIEQRSLRICEICGDSGELCYDGLKNGRPAGWHRTRCEKHLNTRTLWAMSDQGSLLAQQMRDLQIHRHEIELRRLQDSGGDPLAAPFLRGLEAVTVDAAIVEAYIVPVPLGFGHEPGWSLAIFSERSLPAMQRVALAIAAQEASECVEITVEIFSWSENAQELAKAMATGILIWPMYDLLDKERP